MHSRELLEQFRAEELQARLKQLCTQQQRQDATKHKHRERENQVHRSDVFMVGRKQPTTPTM
jgi:hypothetical protein